MDVHLLWSADCPNWELADRRLLAAMHAVGLAAEVVERVQVTTVEQAEQWGFHGSPTVLLDGVDPFAPEGAPAGLSCRVFATPDGLAGSPTVDQLVRALRVSLGR